MSFFKRNIRMMGAFGALATLALAVSCTGFFVKPTLSSIAVGPANPTIETGTTNNTVQMTSVGTYNDGSTGNPSVSWTTSNSSIATVSASGLVTSVSTGTATITATANVNPSITGTQTVTVTVGCIESIAITPTSPVTFGPPTGGTLSQQYTANATTCNGIVDITQFANWSSSNTSEVTVSAGLATATETAGLDSPVTISASSGGVTSNVVTINLTGF